MALPEALSNSTESVGSDDPVYDTHWLLGFKNSATEEKFNQDKRKNSRKTSYGLILYLLLFMWGLSTVFSRGDVSKTTRIIMIVATTSVAASLFVHFIPLSVLGGGRSIIQSCIWMVFGLTLTAPVQLCVYVPEDEVMHYVQPNDPSCVSVNQQRLPFFEFLALAINMYGVILIVRVRWWHAVVSWFLQHLIVSVAILVKVTDSDSKGQLHLMAGAGLAIFAYGSYVLESNDRSSFRLRSQLAAKTKLSTNTLQAMNSTMDYVANQVRSPIHSSHGLLGTIREELVHMTTQQVEGVVAMLSDNTSEVMKVTDTLVRLGRLRAKAWPPRPKVTDLRGLVNNVVRSHGGVPPGVMVRYCPSTSMEPGHRALVDGGQLKTVLQNAFANAVTAVGAQGTIDIFATVRRWTQKGDYRVETLLVEMVDSGKGLGSRDVAALMQEFTEDHAQVALGRSSTLSLGLPLCSHLARALKGTTGILNRPDGVRGAKFWVEVPIGTAAPMAVDFSYPQEAGTRMPNRVTAPEPSTYVEHVLLSPATAVTFSPLKLSEPPRGDALPPSAVKSLEAASASPFLDAPLQRMVRLCPRQRRSVVVVDTKLNCYLMSRYLKRIGVMVSTCSSGTKLRKMVKNSLLPPPDAIFIDVSIPSVQGVDGVSDMQADDQLKSIPIVAMSAHLDLASGNRARYLLLGCTAALCKPFSPVDVEEAINELFKVPDKRRSSGP